LYHGSGAQGFNWGFENYRTLVLNPQSSFLVMPDEAISELAQMGVEFFLDVSDWGEDAPNPQQANLAPEPSTSEPILDRTVEDDLEDL
jgi:hypothetical protein